MCFMTAACVTTGGAMTKQTIELKEVLLLVAVTYVKLPCALYPTATTPAASAAPRLFYHTHTGVKIKWRKGTLQQSVNALLLVVCYWISATPSPHIPPSSPVFTSSDGLNNCNTKLREVESPAPSPFINMPVL